MSARLRSKHSGTPLSDNLIKSILKDNPKPSATRSLDDSPSDQDPDSPVILKHVMCLDDCPSPDSSIKQFTAHCREVISRYEENLKVISQCDIQIQDLLHYAELGDKLRADKGYHYYKLVGEVRKARRQAKTENDYLQAAYDFYKSNQPIISALSQIQGKSRAAKESVLSRQYTARTDILDDLLKR